MMLDSKNPKLEPRLDTFDQAMAGCYACAAPLSAARIVATLTRRLNLWPSASHPAGMSHPLLLAAQRRPPGDPLLLTTRAACSFLQTVVDSGKMTLLVSCLRMLDALGYRQPPSLEEAEAKVSADRAKGYVAPQRPFSTEHERSWARRYVLVLADALSRLVHGQSGFRWDLQEKGLEDWILTWKAENDARLRKNPEDVRAMAEWMKGRLDKEERRSKLKRKSGLRSGRPTGKSVDAELRQALGPRTVFVGTKAKRGLGWRHEQAKRSQAESGTGTDRQVERRALPPKNAFQPLFA